MEIKGSRSILGRFWRDLLETDMKRRSMRLLYEEKEGSGIKRIARAREKNIFVLKSLYYVYYGDWYISTF